MRGEYRLRLETGAAPSAAEVEDAARTVAARLESANVSLSDVRTAPDGTITVDLPPLTDEAAIRLLIRATGTVQFVPIPENESVASGDPVPPGIQPIFGRDAIAEVTRSRTVQDVPALDIILTPIGAQLLDEFASRSVGQQLAIVAEEIVLSAPVIQAPRFGGELSIAGQASQQDVLFALLTLPPMSGALEELTFGPIAPPEGCVNRP